MQRERAREKLQQEEEEVICARVEVISGWVGRVSVWGCRRRGSKSVRRAAERNTRTLDTAVIRRRRSSTRPAGATMRSSRS